MNFPTLINWANLFRIRVLLGSRLQFNSNFESKFSKQTVQNLIRRRDMRRLIWGYTVCQCPIKRTLDLHVDGLSKYSNSFYIEDQIYGSAVAQW